MLSRMRPAALGRILVVAIGLALGLPLLRFVVAAPLSGYLFVFAPVAAAGAFPTLVVACTAGSLAERRSTLQRFIGGLASGCIAASCRSGVGGPSESKAPAARC